MAGGPFLFSLAFTSLEKPLNENREFTNLGYGFPIGWLYTMIGGWVFKILFWWIAGWRNKIKRCFSVEVASFVMCSCVVLWVSSE